MPDSFIHSFIQFVRFSFVLLLLFGTSTTMLMMATTKRVCVLVCVSTGQKEHLIAEQSVQKNGRALDDIIM